MEFKARALGYGLGIWFSASWKRNARATAMAVTGREVVALWVRVRQCFTTAAAKALVLISLI